MAWGRENRCDSSQMDAILGKEIKFEGALEACRGIRVDGRYRGLIRADGDVVIGEEGVVEAQVWGRNVLIAGEVRGQVYASGKLELTATGKLYGDMQAASMRMEEGAVFNGRCQASPDLAESAGKSFADWTGNFAPEFPLTAIATTKNGKREARHKTPATIPGKAQTTA